MSRTAPLTLKRCILYIYSSSISTEYFKHALYSPFFLSSKCSLFRNANFFGVCIIHILYTECAEIKQNAVCFVMLTSLVSVLCTFYIQDVLKLKKKIIPAPNG